VFPDPKQGCPVLVHAPSDQARKGTQAVEAAVKQLAKEHRFEFKLIHQLARKEELAAVGRADVFVDQFTIGAEGLAALEAMALGKPVVCFIKESIRARYPAGFPVVVADQNNLVGTLAELINNGAKRSELGRQGRNYVEAYHDARSVAAELIEIYEDLCKGPGAVPARRHSQSRHWKPLNPKIKEQATCAL